MGAPARILMKSHTGSEARTHKPFIAIPMGDPELPARPVASSLWPLHGGREPCWYLTFPPGRGGTTKEDPVSTVADIQI